MVFQARVLEQVYRLQFLYEFVTPKKAQSAQPRQSLLECLPTRSMGTRETRERRDNFTVGKHPDMI